MSRGPARRFDYEEAQRLRASGLSYKAIGERLGVSDTAIYWACNPKQRARSFVITREWQRRGTCIECGAQCSRTGGQPLHRCRRCSDKARVTTVRDTEMECVTCKQWKPDDAFPLGRRRDQARRGRHRQCRVCLTVAKRKWRERTRVPCSHGCGRMVEGKNRRKPDKPHECVPCATARITTMLIAEGRLGKRKAA